MALARCYSRVPLGDRPARPATAPTAGGFVSAHDRRTLRGHTTGGSGFVSLYRAALSAWLGDPPDEPAHVP